MTRKGSNADLPRAGNKPGHERLVLRLMKNAPALRAIESDQVDAIVDPGTGKVVLLSEVRKLLHKGKASPTPRRAALNPVPVANSVLIALPNKEYRCLLAGLEPVTLTYGEVLYEPGEPIQHVYFPNNSLVSLLTTVSGHQALEVGLVGWEGMLGVPLALGFEASPVRAVVQATGTALRMKSARFLKEFRDNPSLQRELYRYSHLLTAQVAQTAACNRFHRVPVRLARWLLMTRDRVLSDRFYLTHGFLADMLGVQRSAVTLAAGALQRRKLIDYRRGDITILDRRGLQAASCECYQIIKDMFDVEKVGAGGVAQTVAVSRGMPAASY
jgi:CRP-like cAMP-binding protein